MPAWATVVLTLGASGIAVGGTLLAGLLQERRVDARAERAAYRERVSHGMDVLGRVKILLSDADPDRLGIDLQPDDPFGTLRPLSEDWQANLRPDLVTFTLADESQEIRYLGERLSVAVSNSLTATGWFLSDLAGRATGGRNVQNFRQQATADHGEALNLAGQLETAIRER